MGLPQREGRPSLDLTPDATPTHADWTEHYGNKPANECNEAVPVGHVKAPFHNGWAEAGEEEYAYNPAADKPEL